MTIASYSTLLTLLALGSVANCQSLFLSNGQVIELDDSQGLRIGLQNLYADEKQSPMPVQTLPELWTQLQALPQLQFETGQYLPIQPELNPQDLAIENTLEPNIILPSEDLEPQPWTGPQYVFVPCSDELVRSLSSDNSAQLEDLLQLEKLNPRLWNIRVPPSETPWYLVLVPPVPQEQYLTSESIAQLLINQPESQSSEAASLSQTITIDSLIKSLQDLLQSQSGYQSQNLALNSSVQSHEAQLQSELQNIYLDTLSQSLQDLSQTQSENQSESLALNSSAQSKETKSQSESQNIAVDSSAQSHDIKSQSQLQSQSQNKTVDSLAQSRDINSQSQSQNTSEDSSVQSHDIKSQSQLQSQSQNKTVDSLAHSLDINSQSQSQNTSEDSSAQSHDIKSQSQLQSQSQNKTVDNLAQSRDINSQSQSQNTSEDSSAQSHDIKSQSQLQPQSQNKTVDNLAQSRDINSQSQVQSQSQNLAVNSSAQSQAAQSQNLAFNITVQQEQSRNETQEKVKDKLEHRTGQHEHYLTDSPPEFFSVRDIEDDSRLGTLDLIEKYGYPSEIRYAYTDDGYQISLHRIPRPGAPPVLLVHGLMASSASWVQFGPSNGLAYILYREGYDVWMLNTRGNLYSRKHKIKGLKPRSYWDFSFHEIGVHDLPASIDLILELTGQPKVHYIGHSQGSTIFFVMCSERPEYAAKVSLMQALAPTVYMQDNRSPVLKFLGMFKGKFSMLINLLGGYEISANTKLIKQFRQHICASELASRICAIFDFVLCGFDWKHFNQTLTPIVAAHASQGASAKLIYHYAQLQGDLNFQHFDHGPVLNRIRYQSHTPPQYNLSRAHSKVVLHHGSGDWLGAESDVGHLQRILPNLVESRKVRADGFAHFDFTISKDVRQLVYDSVLGHLASDHHH